jgi:hypothetical protein
MWPAPGRALDDTHPRIVGRPGNAPGLLGTHERLPWDVAHPNRYWRDLRRSPVPELIADDIDSVRREPGRTLRRKPTPRGAIFQSRGQQ